MGNSSSTGLNKSDKSNEKGFNHFYDVIDYIATYYILTMDFQSLRKLSEKQYCDKLVILTSDIIEKYFNDVEITYLAQRIKDGVEVNNLKTEKVVFINKNRFESFDISNDQQKNIKKKRVCIGIAKFYIKIAHIFAAIVMTINPVYTYNGPNGEIIKAGLLEKDKIPKKVNRKLYKLNICDNRIRALKKGEIVDDKTGEVTIQPKVCNINIDSNGNPKTLMDEPGIPELVNLYLDDKYDYSTGNFTGMTDSTNTQFRNDLKTFYTAFTGNTTMPSDITKFSDIKLRTYKNTNGCQGPQVPPLYGRKYTLNKKDKLFIDYATNINNMIQSAADNQSKLLTVINDLFTYVNDPYTGKKVIKVNPKLTDDLLQKTIEKTRRLIIDLYVKCETDYVNGMKIYEAIVESKILETTKKQIETLTNEASKIIDETKNSATPPTQKINIPTQLNHRNISQKASTTDSVSNVVPISNPDTITSVPLAPAPAPAPVPVPAPNLGQTNTPQGNVVV